MKGAPEGSKRPTGFTEQAGITRSGEWIFFGFKFADNEQIILEMAHENLSETIKKLQALAHEAQQRRLKANPATELSEAKARSENALHQLYFDADVTGQLARLMGTTKDGLPVEVQIPYKLVEGMQEGIADLLKIMRERQAGHRNAS